MITNNYGNEILKMFQIANLSKFACQYDGQYYFSFKLKKHILNYKVKRQHVNLLDRNNLNKIFN